MIMVKVNSNCDGNWRGSYWPWWLSSGLPSGNCYGGTRTGKWAFCPETNCLWTNCLWTNYLWTNCLWTRCL